jgi:hypothetical protein
MKTIYNLLIDHAVRFFEPHGFQKKKDAVFKTTALFEKEVEGIIDCCFIRIFPDTDYSRANIQFGVKSTKMAKYIQFIDSWSSDKSVVMYFH